MTKIKPNLDNISFLERAQDFLDTYQFPEELVIDVVRKPDSREMDAHAAEVGYPVVRCRRGDITAVLGLRDPEAPTVMFVWLHTPDDDHTGGTKKTGGASGSSLPTSQNALRGWLVDQGCKLVLGGSGHFKVYYRDSYIGTIGQTVRGRSVNNDFTRIRKGLMAAKIKEEFENRE